MQPDSEETYTLPQLLQDFPELEMPDIVFEKEIYAHFGLLYMGFALFEHSLINVASIRFAIAELRSRPDRRREDWPNCHDKGFQKASSQTLGNLIAAVSKVREFHDMGAQYNEAKRIRDYFSHHFFRREAAHMGERSAALALLLDMRKARLLVDRADTETSARLRAYMLRLGWPEIDKKFILDSSTQIEASELNKLRSGTLPRGISRWLERGPED